MSGFGRIAFVLIAIVCQHDLSRERKKIHIAFKLLTMLFMGVLTLLLSTVLFAQEATAQNKAVKQGRCEGVVVRNSEHASTLTVRKVGSMDEKTVRYGSSTRWVSQEHGSKEVKDIAASQVKDGDRVICMGIWNKDGTLHATLISKRLSHSP